MLLALVGAGLLAASLVSTGGARAAATSSIMAKSTPRPTPSPTAEPTLALELPYRDDFSEPGNWTQATNPERVYRYAWGGYLITVLKKDYVAWSFLPDFTLQDVRVDVDASEVAPAVGGGVGITCRVQDGSNFYTFVVGDGYYRIIKALDGTYSWLGAYAQPNSYQTKGDNHLRAECVNNWFTLSLNGETLLQVQDTESSFATGAVGLWVETTQPGLQALFKNFSIEDASGEPTPEPQPVSAPPAKGKVLIQEDFSDSSTGWPEQTDGDIVMEYAADGGYHVLLNQERTPAVGLLPEETFDNVTIQADVVKNDGLDEGSTYGMVCRAQDEQNLYWFVVGADGTYGIVKIKDGYETWLAYHQLQPSDILPGNDTNQLRADCAGNQLSLYANGKQLAQVADDEFGSGQVGLRAVTSNAGLDLLFTRFEVRQAK
jgi:hypothetical protein